MVLSVSEWSKLINRIRNEGSEELLRTATSIEKRIAELTKEKKAKIKEIEREIRKKQKEILSDKLYCLLLGIDYCNPDKQDELIKAYIIAAELVLSKFEDKQQYV